MSNIEKQTTNNYQLDVLRSLDKGVRRFNMEDLPFLKELSNEGEYMQRSRLSINITELANVMKSPNKGGTRKK